MRCIARVMCRTIWFQIIHKATHGDHKETSTCMPMIHRSTLHSSQKKVKILKISFMLEGVWGNDMYYMTYSRFGTYVSECIEKTIEIILNKKKGLSGYFGHFRGIRYKILLLMFNYHIQIAYLIDLTKPYVPGRDGLRSSTQELLDEGPKTQKIYGDWALVFVVQNPGTSYP